MFNSHMTTQSSKCVTKTSQFDLGVDMECPTTLSS